MTPIFKMLLIFMALLSSGNAGIFKSSPTKNVLNIDKSVGVVGGKGSCDAKNWGGDATKSCTCCLVKDASVPTYTPEMSANVLKGCVAKKYCTLPILSQMKKSAYTNSDSNLIASLTQKHTAIKTVSLDPVQLKRNNGLLDNSLVVDLLSQAAASGDLKQNADLFKQGARCILAKPLGGGGAQTLQLFAISFKQGGCGVSSVAKTGVYYILKEMKLGTSEVSNMEKIRQSPLSAYDSKNPQSPYGPLIAFDAQNLSYSFAGKNHRLALINVAAGQSYASILNNQQLPDESVQTAFQTFGRNLAQLHKAFMDPGVNGAVLGNTYVHGDLHLENVFYDAQQNRTILIDNESFAASLAPNQKRPVSVDLLKFYGMLVASLKSSHRHGQQIPPQKLHELVLKPFLKGYIGVFETKEQAVLAELKNIFLGQNALKIWQNDNRTFLNPVALKKAQSQYVAPIFDELAASSLSARVQPTNKDARSDIMNSDIPMNRNIVIGGFSTRKKQKSVGGADASPR